MKRFECLLFIDDNYPTNYYHKEIALEAKIAESIIFFQSAEEALLHLEKLEKDQETKPEIIFLDINMPEMNSWEFLDLYADRIKNPQSKIVILSTSINPMDKAMALNHPLVTDFLSKPLTLEYFQKLSQQCISGI